MMDWEKAEQYLKLCEKIYTDAGITGIFALTITIRPLRSRFSAGERTQKLYNEIMEIEL